MGGNGYGEHIGSRAQLMREHDALPPYLRHLSNYAVAKCSAVSIRFAYDQLRAAGRPHAVALAGAARWLAEADAKDTREDYGPHHPEAAPAPVRRKTRT
jgi:hypothetical protein